MSENNKLEGNTNKYGEVIQISQLDIENVMRLEAVSFKSDGKNLVVVGGDNGQGKTSLLTSIASLLGGKKEIPDKPVKDGQLKGSVIGHLTNGWRVKRTFTKDGGGTLTITSEEDGKFDKPQDMLNEITNSLTFDPVKFLTLKPKDQLDALKEMLKIDFSALDKEYDEKYARRTAVKKEIEDIRAKVKNHPVHAGVPNAEQSAADLIRELTTAKEKNSKKAALTSSLNLAEKDLTVKKSDLAQIEAEIKSLKDRLEMLYGKESAAKLRVSNCEEEVKSCDAAVKGFAEIDTTDLQNRLNSIEDTNRKVRENQTRTKWADEGRAKVKEEENLSERIKEIDEEKRETLQNAEYPVEGLSLGESGIMFEGLPFSQASSAQKLRVSVAMAAASHPKLGIMLIRDGSLMDIKSLQLLGELAEEFNLQVWVERVSRGRECSLIIHEGKTVDMNTLDERGEIKPEFKQAETNAAQNKVEEDEWEF